MINLGSLLVTLKLHDQLAGPLARASKRLDAMGAKIRAIGAGMASAGKSLAMGLTVPIVAMGAAAGIAFGSFEKNMNKVKALTGETGDAFDGMTQLAKDLGKTTKFSASEAADAMGFLAMAGFKADQIMGSLPGVLELAASANLDLASAADITTNILTGYGRTVEEVSETNDVLVKAFTSANTDLVQLGQAFKFVGPVAKGAGIAFEETTAMLALMGNAGIQAGMAGTSLRGAITRLLNPTNKINEALVQNGIITKDAEGNLLPLSDVVQQLGERSVSTADMMTIFGMRAGPAMVGLVGQGHEAIRKLQVELEGAGGIAKRVAEIQMEGLNGAFIRFKSAAEGAAIEIGEKLAPMFISLFEKGIKLSNWISNTLMPAFERLSPFTKAAIIATIAFAAAIGPLLIVLGHMALGIGAVMIALGKYTATANSATTKTNLFTVAMTRLNKTFLARGVKVFFAPAIAALGKAATIAASGISLLIKRIAASTIAQKLAAAATWLYVTAKKALMVVVGGGRALFMKFIAFLGASTLAQGAASVATFTLAGAFTALWTATGIGLIALAAVAAGFALFKFAQWIAEVYDFGAAWIKLKGTLGLLTDAEVEAQLAAREMKEEFEEVESTTEELEAALGNAAFTGTVEELRTAMHNMGAEAMQDELALATLMDGIKRLDEEGVEPLTADLQYLLDEFEKQQAETEAAAKKTDDLRKATEEADEATQQWADDVEALRKELSGDGLGDELRQLEEAYSKLTPQQKANEHVMRRMVNAASSLTDEGEELTGSLRDYIIKARSAEIITRAIEQAHKDAADEAEKFTQDVKRLADRMGDRGLARDTEVAVEMFKDFEDATERNHQDTERLGRLFLDLRNRGAELTPKMLELVRAYQLLQVQGKEVHDSHVELHESITALADSLDPASGLPEDIHKLSGAMGMLEDQDRLTELSLIEIGNAALELEARGASLTPNLQAAADAAREVKDAGSEAKDSLETLARAFEQLANISGGTFAGVAKAIGTTIASMKVAGESGDLMKGSLDRIKSGDTIGGMADLASGVMGVVGALDAATSSGNKAQRVLGGMAAGAKAGSAFGPIGSAVGAAVGGIVGWIRSNGPSAMEKEARNLVDVFQDNVISNLNSSQLDEAKGRKWAQVVIGVRDAYIVAGKTAKEAEEIVGRLWEAIKEGPDAVAPIIAEIEGVTQAGIDAVAAMELLTTETIQGLTDYTDQILATGKAAPEALQPYLDKLLEAGLITHEDKEAMMALTDQTETDFAGMEAAANKYGIELSALGPKFAAAEMEKAAEALSADWAILTENGADVNAVMDGMQDEVQDLVTEALKAGRDIPLNMQPIIDSMIEQGRLTDENGVKLTDTSKLNFAEPIAVKFDALITKIGELIDKLAGPGPESATSAVGALADDLNNLPNPNVEIKFDYELPSFEMGDEGGGYWGGPSYQHGTRGFQDFGSGTLAMLHGREAVVPEGQTVPGSGDGGNDLRSELNGLRADLRTLPLHIRDAILLGQ